MENLDWSQCPAVESIPGKVSGAWVLRGTRTPAITIFENLKAGMSIDEVIQQFPVNRQEIDALMAFAAKSARLQIEPSRPVLILFDNGTPRGLAKRPIGHTVTEARSLGWEAMANGESIESAEKARFELIVTTGWKVHSKSDGLADSSHWHIVCSLPAAVGAGGITSSQTALTVAIR
jgi:uncharacterized protein (DUF433 family)